jgi:hypothetical protein
MKRTRRIVLGAGAALLLAAPFAPALVAQARGVSSNWAGWVAVMRNRHRTFTAVAGTWRVPTVNCEGDAADSASAYWVGLGGDRENSTGLEQIGTDSDCEHGRATYYAWYELIPAESVVLRLRVAPGDEINAFTQVHGHYVTFRITDVTRRRRVVLRRYAPYIDLSSAEWIVEAPLSCSQPHSCSETRLADFGSVDFLAAQATSGGRTASIGSRHWQADSIELQQAPIRGPGGTVLISADPGRHTTRRGGFVVYWRSSSPAAEQTPTQ